MLKTYCDGACNGNPVPAGSGISIYSPVGGYDKIVTNNTAELKALFKMFCPFV